VDIGIAEVYNQQVVNLQFVHGNKIFEETAKDVYLSFTPIGKPPLVFYFRALFYFAETLSAAERQRQQKKMQWKNEMCMRGRYLI